MSENEKHTEKVENAIKYIKEQMKGVYGNYKRSDKINVLLNDAVNKSAEKFNLDRKFIIKIYKAI